jgi:hypothetical protein
MSEPVTKDEWRQYFLEKLVAVQRRVEATHSDKERAELRLQAEDLRVKIRLFDYDASAWWPPSGASAK